MLWSLGKFLRRTVGFRTLFVGTILNLALIFLVLNVIDLDIFLDGACASNGLLCNPESSMKSGVSAQLPKKGCHIFNYWTPDPIPFHRIWNVPDTGPAVGHRLQNMQVWLDGMGNASTIALTSSCARNLKAQGARSPAFASYGSVFQYVYSKEVREQDSRCRSIPGTWFIIAAHKYRVPHNLFDQLSTEWYHTWLAKIALGLQDNVFMTHINGDESSVSDKYAPIHNILGQYVNWRSIVHSKVDNVLQTYRCIQFENAIALGSGWLWMSEPVPNYRNAALQQFIDTLVSSINMQSVKPDLQNPRALFAARGNKGRTARFVLNEAEILQAMKAVLPTYVVHHVDMGSVDLTQAVLLMRICSIFLFSHGGAGPNLLWMHPGSVVVELFPHMTADPMYRNLAVMTGKSYISWQAPHFADQNSAAADLYNINTYHFSIQSSFVADVEEVAQLIFAAALVSKGTVTNQWVPANLDAFTTDLTPWSKWGSDGTSWTAPRSTVNN